MKTPELDSNQLRTVAQFMAEELSTCHFCRHEQEWGAIKTDMAAVKDALLGDGKDLKSLREEFAALRAERRLAAYILNIMVGLLGAALGIKLGR